MDQYYSKDLLSNGQGQPFRYNKRGKVPQENTIHKKLLKIYHFFYFIQEYLPLVLGIFSLSGYVSQ